MLLVHLGHSDWWFNWALGALALAVIASWFAEEAFEVPGCKHFNVDEIKHFLPTLRIYHGVPGRRWGICPYNASKYQWSNPTFFQISSCTVSQYLDLQWFTDIYGMYYTYSNYWWNVYNRLPGAFWSYSGTYTAQDSMTLVPQAGQSLERQEESQVGSEADGRSAESALDEDVLQPSGLLSPPKATPRWPSYQKMSSLLAKPWCASQQKCCHHRDPYRI